ARDETTRGRPPGSTGNEARKSGMRVGSAPASHSSSIRRLRLPENKVESPAPFGMAGLAKVIAQFHHPGLDQGVGEGVVTIFAAVERCGEGSRSWGPGRGDG